MKGRGLCDLRAKFRAFPGRRRGTKWSFREISGFTFTLAGREIRRKKKKFVNKYNNFYREVLPFPKTASDARSDLRSDPH